MRRLFGWLRQQTPIVQVTLWGAIIVAAATIATGGLTAGVAILTSTGGDAGGDNEGMPEPRRPGPTATLPTRVVTPSPTPSPTGSPAESVSPIPTGTPGSTVYLYDMEALRHYSWATGSFTMSGELYGRSVQHQCGYVRSNKPQVWSTAGYDRLTATVGIADDDRDALGNVGQVSIQDQDGVDLIDPFDVALGSTHPIDIDLDGAVQIQIFCWGRESETGEEQYDFYAVFGDAALHSDPN